MLLPSHSSDSLWQAGRIHPDFGCTMFTGPVLADQYRHLQGWHFFYFCMLWPNATLCRPTDVTSLGSNHAVNKNIIHTGYHPEEFFFIFFRNKCLNLQNVFIGKADNALLLKGITFACENTIPLITTRAWLCHVCFGQCSRSASAGHWLTPRRQPRSKTKAITFHPVQTLRAR